MAHIAYIADGQISLLYASFELARRLVNSGHRVTYLSPADIGERVEAQQFTFVRLTEDRLHLERARVAAAPPPWNLPAVVRWLIRRMRIRHDSIKNDEIECRLTELGVDAVLVDIELHFPILATVGLGLPVALPTVFFTLFHHDRVPPLHSGLIPRTDGSHDEIERLWSETRREAIRRRRKLEFGRAALLRWLRPVGYDTRRFSDLRAVARSRDIDLGAVTDASQWLRPFVYPSIPILYQNAWEMEFPHTASPNSHYVGPMVHTGRAELVSGGSEAGAWLALKTRRQESNAPGPLIYCSPGSFFAGDVEFLRRIVDVFRRRQDWTLVMGLGNTTAKEDLEPVPDNVILLDWAPQLDVLREADAAITHGGASTICECIHMNVPILSYPTDYVDHQGNSARVVYHGLGIRGDRRVDDTAEVEAKIEKLLTDPDIIAGVAAMREHSLRYEREQVVESIIERLISGSLE